jgi:hypothetical protein
MRETSAAVRRSLHCADFRGNTNESRSRTLSYMPRNRLLAPKFGSPG